jgi:hypothetical protein
VKRALLVGIDDYDHFNCLAGCSNDVAALEPLLARHENDSPNFACRAYTTQGNRIERTFLLDAIVTLLEPGADVALFYFAGHGEAVGNDVVLITQDGQGRDLGVPFSQIWAAVQESKIPEIILLLDCCFSGGAGRVPQLAGDQAVLRHGTTILTASRGDQPAAEMQIGRGMFSYYLCGGLEGGAADVLGKVPWQGSTPTFRSHSGHGAKGQH